VAILHDHDSSWAIDFHPHSQRYGTSNRWLDGQPAVLRSRVGRGSMSYIGAVLDPQLMHAAAHWMVEPAQVAPAFGPVPEGVEVCRRVGPEHQVYLLISHARQSA
jgi:beta-galactosidase